MIDQFDPDCQQTIDSFVQGEEVPTDIYSFRVIKKAKDTSQVVEEKGQIKALG